MRLVYTLIIFLGSLVATAQADITPRISDAFKHGDAHTIAENFMLIMDMTILDQEGSFDNLEAEKMLSKFFAQNPPKDFSVKHQGTSKLNDQYRIGDLVTSKGIYRITFFIKKVGTQMKIIQVKIESDVD